MATYREWDEEDPRRTRDEGRERLGEERGEAQRGRRWGEGSDEWRSREWHPDWRSGEGREAERRRSYGMRRERETGGLLDVEDRGPIDWLGERAKESKRRGRGPKGYKRADERICDEVCERISRSGIDASDVEVKVEGGEVTLSGTVPTRAEKWWVEDLADDVYGVEDVHNQVRVARPGATGERPGDVPRSRA